MPRDNDADRRRDPNEARLKIRRVVWLKVNRLRPQLCVLLALSWTWYQLSDCYWSGDEEFIKRLWFSFDVVANQENMVSHAPFAVHQKGEKDKVGGCLDEFEYYSLVW